MTLPTAEDLAVMLIGVGMGGALAAFVVSAIKQFNLGKDREP